MGNEMYCCRPDRQRGLSEKSDLIIYQQPKEKNETDYGLIHVKEEGPHVIDSPNYAEDSETGRAFGVKSSNQDNRRYANESSTLNNEADKDFSQQPKRMKEQTPKNDFNIMDSIIEGEGNHLRNGVTVINTPQDYDDIQRDIAAGNLPEKRILEESEKLSVPSEDLSIYLHPRVKEVDLKLASLEKRLSKTNIRKAPQFVNEERKEIYSGDWDQEGNKFNGYGIFINKEGEKIEGEWKESMLNGYGRVIYISGDYYEGNFDNGVCSGKGGFYYYLSGYYEGDFFNNQMHGYGTEHYSDKSYYEGNFVYGIKTGRGKFLWEDGSRYEGDVKNNLLEGAGEYFWVDGKYYKGNFKNNLFNGFGYYKTAEGIYEGDFLDNHRHGKGKFTWNESKYYEGEWENGKQHGQGTYVKGDQIVTGKWKNGKYIKKKEK